MIKATSPTDVLMGETEAGRCNGWDRAAGGERAHSGAPLRQPLSVGICRKDELY